MPNNLYRIHEAAEQLGISTRTLKRYEETGILVPKRTESNQRLYSQDEINFLQSRKKPYIQAGALAASSLAQPQFTSRADEPTTPNLQAGNSNPPPVPPSESVEPRFEASDTPYQPDNNNRHKLAYLLLLLLLFLIFGLSGYIFYKRDLGNQLQALKNSFNTQISKLTNEKANFSSDVFSGDLNISENLTVGQNTSTQTLNVEGSTTLSELTVLYGPVILPPGSINNLELVNSSLTYIAGSGLTGGGLVSLGSSATLNIGAGNGISVNDDTIAIVSNPTFSTSVTTPLLNLTNSGYTLALQTATLTGNQTITLPNASGDVCLTTGNCAGLGGTIAGSGTANYLAKFNTSSTIGNSLLYDNGTNVGIGTTTPQATLHVPSTSLFGSSTLPTGGFSNYTKSLFYNDADFYTKVKIGAKEASNYTGGEITFGYGDSSNVWTDLFAFGAEIVGTSNIDNRDFFIYDYIAEAYRLFIGSNGNTGIGTTTPITKLTLSDTANQFAMLDNNSSDTTFSGGTLFSSNDGIFTIQGVNSAGAGSAIRQVINQTNGNVFLGGSITNTAGTGASLAIVGGKVGIGTINPQTQLETYSTLGGTFTGLQITNEAAGSGLAPTQITFSRASVAGKTTGAILSDISTAGSFGNGYLSFLTRTSESVTEKMRITSAGNVGIDDTTPAYLLTVGNGDLFGVNSSGNVIVTALGATDTSTHLCRNASNQLAGCATTGTGANFVQGGNTFGAIGVLGTNDAFDMQFETGGTTKMTIQNSTGFVGIGTATPGTKLEVLAASNKSVASFLPSSITGISDFSTGGIGWQFSRPNDGAYVHSIFSYNNSSDSKRNLAITSRDDLVFATGNGISTATEQLRITATGNVGIGTTAPSDNLHLSSAGNTTVRIQSTAASQIPRLRIIDDNGDYSWEVGRGSFNGIGLYDNTAAATRLFINSTGNVGIGDTTPAYLFTVGSGDLFGVNSSGNVIVTALGATDTSTHLCRNASNQLAGCATTGTGANFVQGGNTFGAIGVLGTNDAFDMQFETGGTTKMTIQNSTGFVGIGTTGPGSLLTVSGNGQALTVGDGTNVAAYSNFAGPRSYFGYDGANTVVQGGTTKGIKFNVNSATFGLGTAMTIDTSGNVGIGTTTPTSGKLQVVVPSTGTGIAITGNFTDGTTRNSGLFSSADPLSFTPSSTPNLLQAAIDGTMQFGGTVGASGGVYANNWDLRLIGSGTFANLGNYNPAAAGANFQVRTFSPFSGTINGELVGGQFKASHTAGAGTVTKMAGIQVASPGYTAGGTVSGPVYGARIANQGNAAWTTSYGLHIDAQSGSTNSYSAIFEGGNVGIGTTAPTQLLHVEGSNSNIKFRGNTGSGTWGYLAQSNTAAYLSNNAFATGLDVWTPDNTSVGASQIQADRGFIALRVAPATLGSPIVWTEALRAISSGNVGIGTTLPLGKLHVNGGDAYFGDEANLARNIILRRNGANLGGITTANGVFSLFGGSTTNTNHLTISSTGTVGIGTMAPGRLLEVYGNDTSILSKIRVKQDGTGDASLSFLLGVATNWTVGADNSDSDTFKISNTEDFSASNHFSITTSGNVGIGTTNPTNLLQINGTSETLHIVTSGATSSFTTDAPVITAPKDAVTLFIGSGTGSESTSAYTADESSGNIRFNGAGVAWGDFGFYPTGGDSGEYGHFRLSLAGVAIDRVPDAKLGVGSLYSAGNVGIGDTTPAYLFTVGSGDLFGVNSSGNVIVTALGATDTSTHLCRNASNQLAGCSTTGTGAAFVQGGNTFGAIGVLGTNDAFDMQFETGGTTKMTIQNSTGFVGIGTTGPGELFETRKDQNAATNIKVRNTDTGASANAGLYLESNGNNFWLRNWGDGTSNANLTEFISTASSSQFAFSTSNSEALRIASNGNVGIGTTSPTYRSSTLNSVSTAGSAVSAITNTNTTDSTNTVTLRLNTGAVSTTTNARFITFYADCTTENCAGTAVGNISLNNGNVAYNTGGADFAERFPVNETTEAGDVIGTNDNTNRKSIAGDRILGVVSDNAGFIGNSPEGVDKNTNPAVGLLGQIRTKVTGDIKKGDLVTISQTPGVAHKATQAGEVLGTALEDFSAEGIGKILVLVRPGWYNPQMAVNNDGSLIDKNADENNDLGLPLITVADSPTLEPVTPNAEFNPSEFNSRVATSSAHTNLKLKTENLESELANLKLKTSNIEQTINLLASGSAGFNNGAMQQSSNSAELGLEDLDVVDLAASGNLNVLGRTTLSDVGITGKMNIGLITLDGLSGEAGYGSINTTTGPLMIQSDRFNGVDILDGKVVIETNGDMRVDGTVTVKKLNVDTEDVASASLGEGVIEAGETKVTVNTSALNENSRIFTEPIDEPVATSISKTGPDTFEIRIKDSLKTNLRINWWIVN